MKKIILIIAINLLVFLGILAICEAYLFVQAQEEHKKLVARFTKEKVPPLKYNLNKDTFDEEYDKYQKKLFRMPNGEKYNRESIILLGRSYVYGYGLKDNETISYLLAEETKRPVYNRAIPAAGLQHIYFQVCRDDFAVESKTAPAFVIYLLCYNCDIDRLLAKSIFSVEFTIEYFRDKTNKNGDLIIDKGILPRYIRSLCLTKYIKIKLINKYKYKNKLNDDDFLFDILMRTQGKLLNKFPNSKFIVIDWDFQNDEMLNNNYMQKHNHFVNKLKENGICIYSFKEIMDNKYNKEKEIMDDYNGHPTAEFWQNAVPQIAKKLGLY